MADILRLLAWFACVLIIGWSVLSLVCKKNTLAMIERAALSYGVGLGLLSTEMMIQSFFNIRFSIFSVLICWIPVVAIALLTMPPGLARHKRKLHHDDAKQPLSVVEKFFVAGISFEIFHAFFRALIKPMEAYDAVATYAIRAKMFYIARAIPHDFFSGLSLLFPHPDYPLNVPLSESFLYLFLGSLNDQLVKVIFPLYFIAILGIMYFAVKRLGGRTSALFFTFLLATIPQFNNFATNGYLDVPLAYYCFAGTVFLLYWFRENRNMGFLYISAIMTALSAWTKNEGFVYCVANILLLALFLWFNRSSVKRKDIMSLFMYIAVILLILAPWLWIKYSAHLVNSDVGTTTLGQLNPLKQTYKVWPIIYEFQRQVFGPKKWNIIWIIILFSAVIYRKKIFSGSQRYITVSLILIVSGYVFAYLIGRDEIRHLVGTTWSRMMIHFLPLAVYWLAALLKDDVKI